MQPATHNKAVVVPHLIGQYNLHYLWLPTALLTITNLISPALLANTNCSLIHTWRDVYCFVTSTPQITDRCGNRPSWWLMLSSRSPFRLCYSLWCVVFCVKTLLLPPNYCLARPFCVGVFEREQRPLGKPLENFWQTYRDVTAVYVSKYTVF